MSQASPYNVSAGATMLLLLLHLTACLGQRLLDNKDGDICVKPGSSCKGKCSAQSARICNCDKKCLLYQDCCEDMQTVCPVEYQKAQRLREKYPHLQPVCAVDKVGSVLKGCPATWQKAHPLVKKCALGNEALDKAYFPVYSHTTKLHYLNRYCAYCNNASDNTLVSWSLLLVEQEERNDALSTRETIPLDKGLMEGLSGVVEKKSGHDLALLWDTSDPVRQCVPEADSTCPGHAPDSQLAKACASFRSYMQDPDSSKIFRNVYCLHCQGLNPCSSLHLYKNDSDGRRTVEFSGIMNWKINIKKHGKSFVIRSTRNAWNAQACTLNSGMLSCTIQSCAFLYKLRNGSCHLSPSVGTFEFQLKPIYHNESEKQAPRPNVTFNESALISHNSISDVFETRIVTSVLPLICRKILKVYPDAQFPYHNVIAPNEKENISASLRFSSAFLTRDVMHLMKIRTSSVEIVQRLMRNITMNPPKVIDVTYFPANAMYCTRMVLEYLSRTYSSNSICEVTMSGSEAGVAPAPQPECGPACELCGSTSRQSPVTLSTSSRLSSQGVHVLDLGLLATCAALALMAYDFCA